MMSLAPQLATARQSVPRRVRDGSRDDSAGNTFKIRREHPCVKTCPGPEGLGYAISNQPVGDISIELKDAHGRNDSGRYLPASSHIVDQVLGVNADG